MSHCHCSRGFRVAGPYESSRKHSKASCINKSNLPAHLLRAKEVIRLTRFRKDKLIPNPVLGGKFVKRGNNYLTVESHLLGSLELKLFQPWVSRILREPANFLE